MTTNSTIARSALPRIRAVAGPARRRLRVVLMQTQAEGAGAQEISRILGRGLEADGYDVHHVFFFRRTAAFDSQPNTFFCARRRPGSPVDIIDMLRTLVDHLRRLQPDVVMCFQHYGNIIGTLAARLAGVRVVVANRTSPKAHMPWWIRATETSLGLAGLFKRLVVNSGTIASEYDRYPARYRTRVVRIDHGFEAKTSTLSRRDARTLLALPAEATLLGSVARLHPDKNLAAAIRLLALEPHWHLAIAGQGACQNELVALAQALGVTDRLHFLGELSPTQIGVLLRALDVFVFPSLVETFGLAPVEAAQAGLPLVVNDLAVLREVLAVDGEPCALFVDTGDVSAFAAAVKQLLTDQELSARLASRGTRLSERYSLDGMVRQYAELIETVVPRSLSNRATAGGR
jgi:glycosyltransferase involved in cell wall biosynthesis